jgi:hypothetical protein
MFGWPVSELSMVAVSFYLELPQIKDIAFFGNCRVANLAVSGKMASDFYSVRKNLIFTLGYRTCTVPVLQKWSQISVRQCCGPEIIFFRIWIYNFFFGYGSFPIEKTYLLFSLLCVWSAFFTNLFLFYNSVWIRIRIRTFFGFGSGQNLRILSDSDPQHWC